MLIGACKSKNYERMLDASLKKSIYCSITQKMQMCKNDIMLIFNALL